MLIRAATFSSINVGLKVTIYIIIIIKTSINNHHHHHVGTFGFVKQLTGYEHLMFLNITKALVNNISPKTFKTIKHFHSTMSNITIGTHNGRFHCDEALACFMLKQLPAYKDATIVRYFV